LASSEFPFAASAGAGLLLSSAIISRLVALIPGARIGPYQITTQIGVGGMGEVYQATDTNLARSVAIKVLPELVSADAERLRASNVKRGRWPH
jgi:serine/threonine protein kinase